MANAGVTLRVKDRVAGGGVTGVIVLLSKGSTSRVPSLATVRDDQGQFHEVLVSKLDKVK